MLNIDSDLDMNASVNTRLNTSVGFFWAVVIISLILLVLASFLGMPGRDSSTFIYVAEGMLSGEVPYSDRWDHKPPLIYLLDLVGLVISGGSIWGIWLLESLFLVCTTWIAFKVIKETFGIVAAGFSISLFLIYFHKFVEGGNLTEEYVLLFQFLSLYLFLQIDIPRDRKHWPPLAIGALAAAAFLLKPNLVGVWLAIGLYWIFWVPKPLNRILYSVAGATLVFLVLFAVLTSVGGWSAFLDAVFSYNYAYSASAALKAKIWAGLALGEKLDLFPLIITSWFLAFGYLMLRKASTEPFAHVLRLALILLPIEVVLVGASGRTYGHYYLTTLPVITILFAFFGRVIIETVKGFANEKIVSIKDEFVVQMTTTALLFAIVVSTVIIYHWGGFLQTINRVGEMSYHGSVMHGHLRSVAKHIQDITSPDDRILVWGAESQIYLLSNRQAPTRFFYQYPLVTPNYANNSMFDEFLSDVKNHKPAVIIDTRNPRLPPLNGKERFVWHKNTDTELYYYSEEQFLPFLSFVEKEYTLNAKLGGYSIYERE